MEVEQDRRSPAQILTPPERRSLLFDHRARCPQSFPAQLRAHPPSVAPLVKPLSALPPSVVAAVSAALALLAAVVAAVSAASLRTARLPLQFSPAEARSLFPSLLPVQVFPFRWAVFSRLQPLLFLPQLFCRRFRQARRQKRCAGRLPPCRLRRRKFRSTSHPRATPIPWSPCPSRFRPTLRRPRLPLLFSFSMRRESLLSSCRLASASVVRAC